MAQQAITIKFYATIGITVTLLKDVEPISISWGLGDNKPETRLADIGSCSLMLDNSSGIYTPGVTTGWKLGIPFFAIETITSTTIFTGYLDSIKLENTGDEKRVKITVLDWLDIANKFPIVNPPLLTTATADEAITAILADMPIQPPNTAFDAGNVIFPTVFDTVKGYTKAYDEFAKLANSELGFVYATHIKAAAGFRLTFKNSTARTGYDAVTQFTSASATVDAEFDNSFSSIDVVYGEHIVNRFNASAYPKRTDTAALLLYQMEKEVYLAPAETKEFRAFWRDATGKRSINAVPPSDFVPSGANVPPGTNPVVSLLHFDEQDGLIYHDAIGGRDWTCSEGDTWVTNPNKYGLGSAYMDGTNSYMTTPGSVDFNFGSDDFTVEWYEYLLDETVGKTTMQLPSGGAAASMLFGYSDATNKLVSFSSDGANYDIANGKTLGVISFTTWVHYAVCRHGNTWYCFKDGVQTDTWSSSATIYASLQPFEIGRFGANYLQSCIDDVRITKGHCFYTAAFTPPTKALTATPGTYFSFWTGANTTGTNIKDSLTTDDDYGTEGATYRVTNGGTVGGYLNITTYGYGIYSDSQLQDTQIDQASIEDYGYQNDDIQQAYQQITDYGTQEGKKVVLFEAQPRMVINSITYNANRSEFLKDAFLNLDVGDVISISSDVHNISERIHYIQGVDLNLRGGLVEATYRVRDVFFTSNGGDDGAAYLQQAAIEFRGGAETDKLNYGYIIQVSGDAVVNRSFSMWLYARDGTVDHSILSTATSGGAGVRIFLATDDTDVYLSCTANRWNGTADVNWTCDTAMALNEWVHVMVDYSIGNVGNYAGIHMNGIEQNTTLSPGEQTGSLVSESGASLNIGFWGTTPNDGLIKDLRIFDEDKSTYNWGNRTPIAEGLYAAGAGANTWMSGVVFRAFNVTPAVYAAKLHTNLATTDIVYDGINLYAGAVTDAPILRPMDYPSVSGIQKVAIEFRGGATTDAINYGYVAAVSADTVTKRGFSMWVYATDISLVAPKILISTIGTSPAAGDLIIITIGGYLTFITNRFGVVNNGQWDTTVDSPVPINEWVHIFVVYEGTSTANNPAFYVNGVEQDWIETYTPAGDIASEVGNNLAIGCPIEIPLFPFNGLMKDVRIIDFDQSDYTYPTDIPTIAAALHTAGAYGSGNMDGVVFQTFTVSDTLCADKINKALAVTDEVLDTVNAEVGAPVDAPILRTKNYTPP